MIKIKMLHDFLYEYIVFHSANIYKMSLLFCINQFYTITIFRRSNNRSKCKKMGCGTIRSPTALSTQKRYL